MMKAYNFGKLRAITNWGGTHTVLTIYLKPRLLSFRWTRYGDSFVVEYTNGEGTTKALTIPFMRRGIISEVRESLPRLSLRLTLFPVYVRFWSRDCDQFESQSVRRYRNGRLAVKAMQDHYEGAEGPCSAYGVPRTVYEAYLEDCAVGYSHRP